MLFLLLITSNAQLKKKKMTEVTRPKLNFFSMASAVTQVFESTCNYLSSNQTLFSHSPSFFIIKLILFDARHKQNNFTVRNFENEIFVQMVTD